MDVRPVAAESPIQANPRHAPDLLGTHRHRLAGRLRPIRRKRPLVFHRLARRLRQAHQDAVKCFLTAQCDRIAVAARRTVEK